MQPSKKRKIRCQKRSGPGRDCSAGPDRKFPYEAGHAEPEIRRARLVPMALVGGAFRHDDEVDATVGFFLALFLRSFSRTGRRKRRSEEHTSELQSHSDLVCRLLLEKKKKYIEAM